MNRYSVVDKTKESEIVTRAPIGYRDVYWCHHLNEPFIISYNSEGLPKCELCNQVNVANLHGWHTFICHILKPGQERRE